MTVSAPRQRAADGTLHARFASDDAHEGMKAFLEKPKPEFTHR